MRGGITGDEENLAWDLHSHMAFRLNEASSASIAAFAEDYRRPVMSWVFQKVLYNLRDYSAKRFAIPG